MAVKGTKSKKDKYYSNQEDVIARAKLWLNDNRPLTNEEVVLWVDSTYGKSLIKGLGRTNYTARLLVRGENGEHEIIVSLPRKMVSQ